MPPPSGAAQENSSAPSAPSHLSGGEEWVPGGWAFRQTDHRGGSRAPHFTCKGPGGTCRRRKALSGDTMANPDGQLWHQILKRKVGARQVHPKAHRSRWRVLQTQDGGFWYKTGIGPLKTSLKVKRGYPGVKGAGKNQAGKGKGLRVNPSCIPSAHPEPAEDWAAARRRREVAAKTRQWPAARCLPPRTWFHFFAWARA